MNGFKVVNENHTHFNFKYTHGLNIAPYFEPEQIGGGLHFFKDITDLPVWLNYGVYLYEVEVPDTHTWVKKDNKYAASALYLANPVDLRLAPTWEYLYEKGVSMNFAFTQSLIPTYSQATESDILKVKAIIPSLINSSYKKEYCVSFFCKYGGLDLLQSVCPDEISSEDIGHAALRGDLAMVQYLYAIKPNPEGNILKKAVLSRNIDLVSYLLDTNLFSEYSKLVAKHWAKKKDMHKMVEFLTKKGVVYEC